MANIHKVLRDLVVGLFHIHEHGFVHCDLKPGNIIVMCDGDEVEEAQIIDFGSVRSRKRRGSVLCTYPFCAPEALEIDAVPTAACDAYSLGATLHHYIYKDYLYDTDEHTSPDAVWRLHKNKSVEIPEHCAGLPLDVYDIMTSLLDPDPLKRQTIAGLYYKLMETIEIVDPDPIMLDSPTVVSPQRAKLIDDIFTATTKDVCTLAVNIMDRYSQHKEAVVDSSERAACVILAKMTLYPDKDIDAGKEEKEAMKRIIVALAFRLYSETCDWVLREKHKCRDVNYALVKEALGTTSDTRAAVAYYLDHSVRSTIV